MAVLIKNPQKLLKIDVKIIKKVTEALLNFLGFQNKDLSILFVDNKKIAAMNKEFFGRNNPTNVISFSYMDGFPGEVLGDIIISVERAEEEAQASGTMFYERLFALIIHGLTHVMGYDHERDERESRKMKYKEKKLIGFVAAHEGYKTLIDEKLSHRNTVHRLKP
jgi:probable rRNA maturation factor